MNKAALIPLAALLTVSCASFTAYDPPIVWEVANAARIGGHATEVLGSPRALKVDGQPAVCFNGTSDGVIVPQNPIAGWPQFTIEILFKPDAAGAEEQRFFHIEDDRSRRLLFETRLNPTQRWALDTFLYKSSTEKLALLDPAKSHESDRWHWVALTFNGQTMTSYVNGVRELNGSVAFEPMSEGRVSLGVRLNQRSWYRGCIAEVRFSSRVLSSMELTQERPSP